MSGAVFQVAYDGEGVRQGSMDVRDLAPALLAIGDLFTAANEQVNGNGSSVAVRVESDFKRGSFAISLIVDQSIIEQAKAFLIGHGITNAEELIKVIFGGTSIAVISGLFKLLKALRGRKTKAVDYKHHEQHDNIFFGLWGAY